MPGSFQFDPHFREAFENAPHTVLGRRLKPYCLWHRFCLEMLNSPLLTGGVVRDIDLLAACVVCQTSFDGTGHVPTFPSGRGFWRRLWLRLHLASYDLKKEHAEFCEYMGDFHSAPKLWPDEESQASANVFAEIDPILDIACHLVRNGIHWIDAWNMPLGAANWVSVTFQKMDGHKVDVWTPQDEVHYQKHLVEREKKLADATEKRAKEKNIPLNKARAEVEKEYWAEWEKKKQEMRAMQRIQERMAARGIGGRV